ncbi:MAG: TOBE domain-containing protein [Castellaniella sp.]|uniref:TOBE domain-containing protein n=1 Tax=Castellaniella sp. TaxID=1955812 RepID=UPI003C7248E5
MESLTRFGPNGARHLDLLHHMTLQTSARNCYEGTIGAIESGRINDRIRLDLDEGVSLNATLTHASTERLGLTEGRCALAFLKAQAVRIRPQTSGDADSNLWTGRIDHRADDDTLTEISLDITPKVRITGLAAPGAPRGSLLAGTTATACFQATDVLIGTFD